MYSNMQMNDTGMDPVIFFVEIVLQFVKFEPFRLLVNGSNLVNYIFK